MSNDDNNCILAVRYGKDKIASFSVIYFTKTNGTTADNVTAWKQGNKTLTIVSESDLTINGLSASKIVHHASSGYYTKDESATIFVSTGDKYKIEGVPVSGFEINVPAYDGRYDSKTTFDQVLSTWKWL